MRFVGGLFGFWTGGLIMAKYIDAEALINSLQSHGAICDFGVFLIEKQPAADVQAPMCRR